MTMQVLFQTQFKIELAPSTIIKDATDERLIFTLQLARIKPHKIKQSTYVYIAKDNWFKVVNVAANAMPPADEVYPGFMLIEHVGLVGKLRKALAKGDTAKRRYRNR